MRDEGGKTRVRAQDTHILVLLGESQSSRLTLSTGCLRVGTQQRQGRGHALPSAGHRYCLLLKRAGLQRLQC